MTTSAERIRSDIEAISRCTESPGNGATRPTFSPTWAHAIDYVRSQLQSIDCDVRFDGAGNLRARPKSLQANAAVWLCGSHLDTVPCGGDYDGVAGVVVALELLRSAAEDGLRALPLELIVFAEEEGTTFGIGMLGSRAMTGEIDAAGLEKLRNAAGQNYLEAGRPFGVDPARLASGTAGLRALVEVHIEQGPGMWQRDERLATVTAIAGRRQYMVKIEGHANHAGTTPMADRHDALAGTAEIIAALEQMSARRLPQTVVTIGRLQVSPNAINVIPGHVEFSIDWRAANDETLTDGDRRIRQTVSDVCTRRGLQAEIAESEAIAACPLDERLGERFGNLPRVVSGALHDSAVLAKYLPTTMLFVPSRAGLSHHPDEFSRVEDIAAAAAAVELVVRTPNVRQLNELGEDQFVHICGGLFENSPWIARCGWAKRPFASLDDLHQKLCGIVASASAEEQLALIRAHPDLVGRMTLSQESAGEQAAAGLTTLSADEIRTFQQNNTAYREKFGFPFVICARQNRKEAILAAFPARLANSRQQEIATALAEIYKIARLRLNGAVSEH